jgi:hypothetical protein
LVLQQAVLVVVVIERIVAEVAVDFEQFAVERIAELVQVVAEQVELVVGLNSDLFDFLPFLFYKEIKFLL